MKRRESSSVTKKHHGGHAAGEKEHDAEGKRESHNPSDVPWFHLLSFLFMLALLLLALASANEATSEAAEEEHEAEEEGNPDVLAFSVFLILTSLIAVTMGFEWAKELAVERSGKEFEPVVEKLFSEMTVLGFLGIVVFCISQSGLLEDISTVVFGKEEADKLTEMLEFIHYLLFLCMLLFIHEVVVLIQLGSNAEHDWAECNQVVQHDKAMNMLEDRLRESGRPPIWRPRKRAEYDANVYCFVFRAMRAELILGRQTAPPFGRFPAHKQLNPKFDYGRYLTHCAAETMEGIVEVPNGTWFFLWVVLLVFFALMLAVDNDQVILMWVFLVLGFGMAMFVRLFRRKVYDIHLAICDPECLPDFMLAREERDNVNLIHRVARHMREDYARRRRSTLQQSTPDTGGLDSAAFPVGADGRDGKTERTALAAAAAASSSYQSLEGGELKEATGGKNGGRSRENSDAQKDNKSPVNSAEKASINGFGIEPVRLPPRRRTEVVSDAASPGSVTFASPRSMTPTPPPGSGPGPRWTRLELPRERSWWEKKLCGVCPNRQHMLYWTQQNGPALHVFLFRSIMLLQATYIAVLLLHFIGVAMEAYGAMGAIFIAVAGLLPVASNYAQLSMLLRRVTHVNSACALRKPEMIAKVIREQKTMKAVRVMLLHHRLRTRLLNGAMSSRSPTPLFPSSTDGAKARRIPWSIPTGSLFQQKAKPSSRRSSVKERLEFWNFQRKDDGTGSGASVPFMLEAVSDKIAAMNIGADHLVEIKRMFHAYDTDLSGYIDGPELMALMASLGGPVTELEADAIIMSVDLDGDGKISCDEFVAWYAEQLAKTPKEEESEGTEGLSEQLIEALFTRFDNDGSGSITVFEFKQGMDELNAGLEEEEIMDLVRELDEDNDGTISLEEFRSLFHRLTAQVKLMDHSKYDSRRGLLQLSQKLEVKEMIKNKRRRSTTSSPGSPSFSAQSLISLANQAAA